MREGWWREAAGYAQRLGKGARLVQGRAEPSTRKVPWGGSEAESEREGDSQKEREQPRSGLESERERAKERGKRSEKEERRAVQ